MLSTGKSEAHIVHLSQPNSGEPTAISRSSSLSKHSGDRQVTGKVLRTQAEIAMQSWRGQTMLAH